MNIAIVYFVKGHLSFYQKKKDIPWGIIVVLVTVRTMGAKFKGQSKRFKFPNNNGFI